MLNQIHPNKIRQILFITVLLGLGITIAMEMFFMLGAFLGAVTLYVLMRNLMIRLVVDYKWRQPLAALMLMLVSLILLVIPVAWLASVVVDTLSPVIDDPKIVTRTFEQINIYLVQKLKLNILSAKNIAIINEKLMSMAQSTLGGTVSILGNLAIMYFMLYFMLTQINDIELWLRRNVPLKHSNVSIVMKEIKLVIYSNAVGIPIVALVQGMVGMLGYFIFGSSEYLLMGVLTGVASVIPVVGSMMIWLPLAIYEMSQGRTWPGILIGAWGLMVIGSVDNIARFMLQKRMSDTHPLITIFGVIIGVNLFGFLGVIFGPLMLSIFILLVKVYIDEFGKAGVERY
ncbi:MAG TPA: AI-2E family transporter [Saprospiraceae bacterium]|nr:AI-2E family transporter [Saprospiraceae bacterium]